MPPSIAVILDMSKSTALSPCHVKHECTLYCKGENVHGISSIGGPYKVYGRLVSHTGNGRSSE